MPLVSTIAAIMETAQYLVTVYVKMDCMEVTVAKVLPYYYC
jgi:hypothetical protein